ncbi:MAG: DUF5309 domain-containing protein [Muribaculaceae bacterium]|nr:DUF5309 domain-containing protein [Muribaculaceae bacterium]
MITTTKVVNQDSPELLRSEIDSRIIKVRPMSTPVDQISRHAASRRAGSMTVEYYSVDNKPFESEVAATIGAETSRDDRNLPMEIEVVDSTPFSTTETIMFTGTEIDGSPVTAYITDISGKTLNGYYTCVNAQGKSAIPQISKGAKVVRMGRAARELDVQTEQFTAIPRKEKNFCQIFKAQIEHSTIVKLSNKEVGWTFSDQEEAAIIDMRMGMERTFLFGNRGRLEFPGSDDVLLTGGIWKQAGKEGTFDVSNGTDADFVKICRHAFTGSNGSARKILIAGSGLIEGLHRIMPRTYADSRSKFHRWGLDFTEMVTKFGTLYVIMSETFDECGHANDGLIIDPEYLTKYSHIPFNSERLDLRRSGQRNSDAIVITEASCLVLRYPKSHMRVIGKSTDNDLQSQLSD